MRYVRYVSPFFNSNSIGALPLFAVTAEAEPHADPITEALEAIDPDRLSPREALDKLYELKRLAQPS